MTNADLKILAVDDNSINLKLLNRTLANSSFIVLTAPSGQEAIDLALKEKPDLILLDVLMPHMDGYETCKILKEKAETRHIPVIFLSAKNETIDKAKGLALGAVDYLTKPFDPIEIVARIRTHMNIREEVIELRRRNEELKQQLDAPGRSVSGNASTQDQLKYIDTLRNTNYREINKFFQVFARVKFSRPPVTTVFIPVLMDNQNYVYLVSGGFEKDYKTSFVQLLLEKYVNGYFKSLSEKSFSDKDLNKIFELILDQFSPDVYDAAFTLSLSYINATRSEMTICSVHQTIPQILNAYGEIQKTELTPVFYESKYARIIKAYKIKIPPGSVICNYLSGKEIVQQEEIQNYTIPALKMYPDDLPRCIEHVYSNLPEKLQDQLITAIKILSV